MTVLTPESLFAETIPVSCGEDLLELYNPSVEDVATIRAGLVAVIQRECSPPFSDALQNQAVLDYLTSDVIPPMRNMLWQKYGMPDDDRAYRAAIARMTDDQIRDLPNAYIEAVGIDAVIDAARNGEHAAGNT